MIADETTDLYPGPVPPPLEPNHCMIDLETMGTDPYSPLMSIGACAFRCDDDETIVDLFHQPITLQSCMDVGLRSSASTIRWWLTDPSVTDAARQAIFAENAVSLPIALDAFTDWLQSRPLQLWGNSARFDLGLLEAAYKACGKNPPWSFRKERCYRTLSNLPGASDIPFERIGTFHNAVHDAVSQALHLRKINQKLQLHL